jgi:hypothetical protein
MRSLDARVIIANMRVYCVGIILSCGIHVVFLKYVIEEYNLLMHSFNYCTSYSCSL